MPPHENDPHHQPDPPHNPSIELRQIHHQILRNKTEGPLRLCCLQGMLLWEPTPDLHHQTAIHRIIQSIRPTSAHGAEVECCVDRLILTKDGSILRPDIALFTTQQCHHPDPLRTLPFAVIEILSPETERNILEIAAPAYQKLGITETLAVSLRTDTLHLWTPGTTGTFQTPITIQLSNGIQITITT